MAHWLGGFLTGLLLIVAGLPGTGALGPTQDDAGTGMDASDDIRLATPIAPGSHAAMLQKNVDDADYYSFDAEKGQAIRVLPKLLDAAIVDMEVWGPNDLNPSAATPYAKVGSAGSGRSNSFTAYETGTYVFKVAYSVWDQNAVAAEAAYTFDLEVTAADNPIAFVSQAPASSIEASWDTATDLDLSINLASSGEFSHPDTVGILVEFGGGLEERYGSPRGFTVTQGGYETTVSVPPADTDLDPGYEQPDLIVSQGLGWFSVNIHAEDVDGSVRVTTYGETLRHAVRVLSESSTTAPTVDTFESDDLVVIHDGETADDAITLPGYTEHGGYSLDLDVGDDRFFGLAHVATDQELHYTPPGGDRTSAPSSMLMLANLAEGEWRFDYGAYSGDRSTDRHALVGAYFPDLGIHDGPLRQVPSA